jgi:hypothetical protein
MLIICAEDDLRCEKEDFAELFEGDDVVSRQARFGKHETFSG